MSHKYGVGQIVDLMHRPLRAAVAGEYEIRRLMPSASDGNPEDPFYRIKSIAEKHERVVPESELSLAASQREFLSSGDASAGLRQDATTGVTSAAQIVIGRGKIANSLATNRAKTVRPLSS